MTRRRCSARGASSSRSAPAWSPTRAAASTRTRSATGAGSWPALAREGREVIMVSSGAIAEGMKRLGWTHRPNELNELQAAAAVGQMGLAQMYETKLREHGMGSAQVLLTHADLADRERYLNARSTLLTLLPLQVVPVINENDTVVNDEIKFGDNDTLGALVANLVEADALVILTDQKACTRRSAQGSRRHASSTRRAPATPRWKRWPAAPAASRQGRHDHQDPGGQARGAQRRLHRDRLGPRAGRACCAWPAARRSARCWSPPRRSTGAQALDGRSPAAARRGHGRRRRGGEAARPRARACCRSA